MTPEQFTYWLKGYTQSFELPSREHWELIKMHLQSATTPKMPEQYIFKTTGDKFPEPPYTITC